MKENGGQDFYHSLQATRSTRTAAWPSTNDRRPEMIHRNVSNSGGPDCSKDIEEMQQVRRHVSSPPGRQCRFQLTVGS